MSTLPLGLVSTGAGFLRKNEIIRTPNPRAFLVRAQASSKEVRVGILGDHDYKGSELVRLLAKHPHFQLTLIADRKEAKPSGSQSPCAMPKGLPDAVPIEDVNFSTVDALFCSLPHGTMQEIIKGLPSDMKIVDLSTDFRLRSIEYEQWYDQPHKAPELQKEAVYGLAEVFREEIRDARLVANPGCYPTSVLLPLIPLLKAHLVEPQIIDIDGMCRSAISGRGPNADGAYSYRHHRYVPEIVQGLNDVSHSRVALSFTQLMHKGCGIQSTIKVKMAPGVTVDDLYQQLTTSYKDEESVRLLEKVEPSHDDEFSGLMEKAVPRIWNVMLSNYCIMNVFQDRTSGRAKIISVIDNMLKGSCGRAIQNLNIMMGYPENTGLQFQPCLS